MKIHLVRIDPHKIRKTHYRRMVALMICTVTAAHYLIPDHEHLINLATNLLWLYDPTDPMQG